MWNQLRRVLAQSAIYGLGNVAISALSFLLIPLYTHYLQTAEFGLYSLITTFYGVFSLLVDCGLTNSVARYYYNEELAGKEPELKRYRQTMLWSALIASSVASASVCIVCYLISGSVARSILGAASNTGYVRLIALTLLFRGIATVPMIYLRVAERSITYALLTVLQVGLFLALNIWFVVGYGLGVTGILYSLLISTAIYSVLLMATIARELYPRFDFAVLRELLRFGLPYVPVLLMMWVIDFSDRYLLDHYSNQGEVGVYSLGYKFGQSMMFIATAFSFGWVPVRFKILQLEEPKAVYRRMPSFYLASAGLAWLALAIFSKEAVALTSPVSFHRAAGFVPLVGFAYLICGLSTISVTGMGIAKRSGAMPAIMVAASGLNVILNVALIPRIGAMGAAYSTIVAFVVLVAGSLYCSQRVYHIDYEYRKCGILLVGLTAVAIAGTSLPAFSPAVTIAMKTALLCVYVALAVVSGILSPSELVKGTLALANFAPSSVSRLVNSRLGRRLSGQALNGEVTGGWGQSPLLGTKAAALGEKIDESIGARATH